MNDLHHGLTSYFSEFQLQKIRSCRIGIVGCGGLGSNIAAMMTRCGFIHFELMDFDRVEAGNLNRQYYLPKDIGSFKTAALIRHLQAINPNLDISTHCVRWTEGVQGSDPCSPFVSCDILFEAVDKAETKAQLINFYADRVPYIVSGNGMAGTGGPQITVERHGNIFLVGDGITNVGKDTPPLAPRVMMCAAAMADTALNLILNSDS